MKIKNVWYRGHERYGFHGREPAEILGLRMITPDKSPARLCLYVKYANGDEDFVPLDEAMKMGYISDVEPQ